MNKLNLFLVSTLFGLLGIVMLVDFNNQATAAPQKLQQQQEPAKALQQIVLEACVHGAFKLNENMGYLDIKSPEIEKTLKQCVEYTKKTAGE